MAVSPDSQYCVKRSSCENACPIKRALVDKTWTTVRLVNRHMRKGLTEQQTPNVVIALQYILCAAASYKALCIVL